MLVHPILVYIQDHLRGNFFGLKNTISLRFDTTSLFQPRKPLWEQCGNDSERFGQSFHDSHSSGALLRDLTVAFDKLG